MKRIVSTIVLIGSLFGIVEKAKAQELTISYSIAKSLDTISTHRFISLGTCVEKNQRYWIEGNPGNPNFKKMWAENAMIISGVALLEYFSDKHENKAVKWITKGFIIGATGRAAYSVGRNIKRCGF